MSAIRRKLKNKKAPDGWELIEEVIEDFEQQMKEAVNEEHDKKRKSELTWKIHRLHWEKNRFIYDLMYQRKVMSRELVGDRDRTLLHPDCCLLKVHSVGCTGGTGLGLPAHYVQHAKSGL